MEEKKAVYTHGLSEQQAGEHLKRYGFNRIEKKSTHSFLSIFIDQFYDPLMYLLVGSAGIIFFVGAQFDAYIILGIVLLNTVIGALQETRIAHVVDQLQNFKTTTYLVVRDKKEVIVEAEKIVPGDLVILQQGEKIPADGKLIKAYHLFVDQSLITGESDGIAKQENDTVYAHSHVVGGYGQMCVDKTGQNTHIGTLKKTVQQESVEMPLQKDLNRLLHFILLSIVVICFALLCIGLFTGKPFGQLLAALTALFICVLPQGLSVIMTVVLVSGAYRMAKKKFFAKKLYAIEALARVDTVILDKTGTITLNELMLSTVVTKQKTFEVSGKGYNKKGEVSFDNVKVTYNKADQDLIDIAHASVFLNHAQIIHGKKNSVRGSKVEAAFGLFAEKFNAPIDTIKKDFEIVHEIPFGSEHKYHAAFVTNAHQSQVYVMGAPEVLFDRSNNVDQSDYATLQKLLEKAVKVVAVCVKKVDVFNNNTYESEISDLTFLGFCGLTDEVKNNADTIVNELQKAGLRVIMATGDNQLTADAIAQKVGLQDRKNNVFARCTPEQKMKLVKDLKRSGSLVAMVGDGVNDGPALAAADLGISIGNSGVDLPQQAADIILLDDAFENIMVGINEGKYIFTSFKRVILYFFTTNFSEISVMLFSIACNLPLPLLASQILWLNLMTDGFLDFSLAMEPYSKVNQKKIKKKDKDVLLTKDVIIRILYQAFFVSVPACFVFYTYAFENIALARTLVVVLMSVAYWVLAINARSLHQSVFTLGFFSNKWLALSLLLIPCGLFGVLYTQWGNLVFQTTPLAFCYWPPILLFGCGIFVFEEVKKAFFYG